MPNSAKPARLLLVSDLNDTVVGDDAATAEFGAAWLTCCEQQNGALLVYNTGRSLQETVRLLSEKAHCLPIPDALVCSLGTRIYWPSQRGDGSGWDEDVAWSRHVAQGWSRDAARDACDALVMSEQYEFQIKSVDDCKVTCVMAAGGLQAAEDLLAQELSARGVEALVITSGQGASRYMTVVPARAGKLAAQEHVRQRFGVPLDRTVSCGDSGNDQLMLAGANAAVVVGNAEPDLLAWAQQQQQQQQQLAASEKQRLYVAKEHEARGVVEGLKQFGFL